MIGLINAVGVALAFLGVVLLFYFGIPFRTRFEGTALGVGALPPAPFRCAIPRIRPCYEPEFTS